MLLFSTVKPLLLTHQSPAIAYAIQGTMLVWTGSVLLMVSIISFFKKLKQTIEYVRTYFKGKGTFDANKTNYP
jgi:hypothetical protein